ncbi:MAG: carboxypeptidase-like regulatory domain-containing protein, partial [Pirellulales bacterium]|nr:carboxypeptidase-like regulatory domain-containing protein [Pirellulales bacterium]
MFSVSIGISLCLAQAVVRAPPIDDATSSFSMAPVIKEDLWQDYVAPRTRRVTGRVVDVAGKPSVGAKVWLAAGFAARPLVEVQTDEKGRFELDAGESVVVYAASSDGRLEASTQWPIFLEAAGASTTQPPIELRLAVRHRRLVKLHVRDERGAPVAGAKLILHQQGWLDELGTTDDRGHAMVPVRRDSEYWEVLAYKPAYGLAAVGFGIRQLMNSAPRFKSEPLEVIEKQLDEWLGRQPDPLPLPLFAARTVPVRVVDQQDRAVPGLLVAPLVSLSRKFEDGFFRSASSTPLPELSRVTDQEGRIVVDFVPGNASVEFAVGAGYFTRAALPRFFVLEPLRWEAAKNPEARTLRVARMVPIRGQVLDSEGKPVPQARVEATARTTSGWAIARDDGSYQVLVQPNHIFKLSAASNSVASLPREGVRVEFETPVEGIDLVVNPLAEITIVGAERVNDPGQSVGRLECLMVHCQTVPLRTFDAERNDHDWSIAQISTMTFFTRDVTERRLRYSLGPGTYAFFGRPWQEPQWFRITDSQARAITMHDPPNWPGESTLTGVVLDLNQAKARGFVASAVGAHGEVPVR